MGGLHSIRSNFREKPQVRDIKEDGASASADCGRKFEEQKRRREAREEEEKKKNDALIQAEKDEMEKKLRAQQGQK